ncbi:PREDICTED: cytoplasmic dynein 1 light intermediate chain 2-like [Elephantulus edwardii]|uniref:cytoplasmic dynein 1 light intermediate chain 2-like n=1 Tax=Elephantulus edwardii TaxID=28737 RepID=UPI0003F05BFB|nr:PREDICTED: cytoplasmic dynein 1 light intermediate chain 2-like [Elephantulus edwardii]
MAASSPRGGSGCSGYSSSGSGRRLPLLRAPTFSTMFRQTLQRSLQRSALIQSRYRTGFVTRHPGERPAACVGRITPIGVEKKLLLGSNGLAVGATSNLTNEEKEGQSLRSSVLNEVSTRARSKLPSGKNILVFGEDGSGKTTLMTKPQGVEHSKKGRGLEYLYLSVQDKDRDDHTHCNVWILDGDLYHKGLLFAVVAESLPETLVIFVADMSWLWTVMESLQKWASTLWEHIDKMKIPLEQMIELEQKC